MNSTDKNYPVRYILYGTSLSNRYYWIMSVLPMLPIYYYIALLEKDFYF